MICGLNQDRVEFSTSIGIHIIEKFTNLNSRGRLGNLESLSHPSGKGLDRN